MIPYVYVFLLATMLVVLYFAGIGLKRNGGKIISTPGIAAVAVYTLNLGLRFGRGIDYNLYWNLYDNISKYGESDKEVTFTFFVKSLSSIGLPYQGLVLIESFMFILGLLFLLRNYPRLLPYALPLFAFFSLGEVENMIRWYLGFSFVLIGLSYLLNDNKKIYFLISCIGCLFHFGLLPVPLLFFFIYLLKKPILHPFVSIPLFFVIGLFFQTSFMLRFVDLFNVFAIISERSVTYASDAQYWLTSGFQGNYRNAFPGKITVAFLLLIVWCGYKCLDKSDHKVVFIYNLFLVGFIFRPIANLIELVIRYDDLFFFFRAVVCATILYRSLNKNQLRTMIRMAFLIFLLNALYGGFKRPFTYPKLCMYIWDKGTLDSETMKQIWLDVNYKSSQKQFHNKNL